MSTLRVRQRWTETLLRKMKLRMALHGATMTEGAL